MRKIGSSQQDRERLNPLGPTPKTPRADIIPILTPAKEEIKIQPIKRNYLNPIPKPRPPNKLQPLPNPRNPYSLHKHNIDRKLYLKEEINRSLERDLPNMRRQQIPDPQPPLSANRKIGSVEGSKREEANRRIIELYKAHPMKNPINVQVINGKDYANGLVANKPPLPAPTKNDYLMPQHYVSPNPMRQAGLAVLERPQHYASPHQWK